MALEGALKLKEISYIHAEGYPAAEMKHGPIALINKDMPVIFIATKDSVYGKILSNIAGVLSESADSLSSMNLSWMKQGHIHSLPLFSASICSSVLRKGLRTANLSTRNGLSMPGLMI